MAYFTVYAYEKLRPHHQGATQMRGGWYSHESRFIRGLSIADASAEQVGRIELPVDTLAFDFYFRNFSENASK